MRARPLSRAAPPVSAGNPLCSDYVASGRQDKEVDFSKDDKILVAVAHHMWQPLIDAVTA